MRKLSVRVTIILATIVALVGCLGMQVEPKPFNELTPKEKIGVAMAQYNKAFSQYQQQFAAATTPMSEEEVAYFKGFKTGLTVAFEGISGYDIFVANEMQPTVEAERALTEAITRLSGLLKGVVE